MKRGMIVRQKQIAAMILLLSFSVGLGEIAENELRGYSRALSIGTVSKKRLRKNGSESRLLRVEFSGGEKLSDELLKKMRMRVAVTVRDLRGGETYFAEQTRSVGRFSYDYMGEGYWEFMVPCRTIQRIRILAYSAQYGIMDGKTFIPFDEKQFGVDSYEELKRLTSAAYPEQCSLRRVTTVED